LLTSVTQKGDAKKAKEDGFLAYLTKPIRKGDLIQTVSLVLGMKELGEENYPIVTTHLEKEVNKSFQPKILLVEDNLINQKVAVKTLQKKGYHCDVALNGEEAFKAWSEHGYDLILMDCQMPVMDGYEATRKIRQAEDGNRRTIIMAMTAYAMEGDKDKCVSAGMDEYFTKPIDFDQVADYIEGICKNRHNTQINLLESFKIEFMKKSRFNQEEADDIFSDFIKIFLEHIESLEKAMCSNDYEQIEKIAHQIKGASGNLRIDPIMQLAEKLEIGSKRREENLTSELIQKLSKYKEIFQE